MDGVAEPDDVIAWLRAGGPWGAPPEVIETHGALVFLTDTRAFKMKKAVNLGYLDFSTLASRRHALERELELNRRTAPGIYLQTIPVRRSMAGLELAGVGEVVEWLLEMVRFPPGSLLSDLWRRGGLSDRIMEILARRVARFHDEAGVVAGVDWPGAVSRIVRENAEDLRSLSHVFERDRIEAEIAGRQRLMEALAPALAAQAHDVRHCHGDLHLGNVFLDGETPTLFDCIEFNDFYAIIPPLYDLAFLLMDLLARDERRLASRTLNAWLMARDVDLWPDVMRSLAALPLYVAMRAEIRAKTEARRPGGAPGARRYLDLALEAGRRNAGQARIIAIGGLSGTGKSTIARALVPLVGGAVGGVHLRSDEIRKRLSGVGLEERLPPSAYTAEASRQVYDTMMELARLAAEAGMAVVVDAVQAREEERRAIEEIARAAGVAFDGIWLEAPAKTLEARIASRRGDVSDATVDVLQQQLGYALGEITWKRVDVSGGAEAVSTAVRAHLRLS